MIGEAGGAKIESLFRTPYFCMDRLTLDNDAPLTLPLDKGFHHLFVHAGTATVGGTTLERGRSYIVPAGMGEYTLSAREKTLLLKTFLPV